jgi:amino acid permease
MIKRFFNKPWVGIVLVVLVLWVVINFVTASIYYATGSSLFGETEFWPSFWNMTIGEFVILGGAGLIVAAMVWFIKGIRKGLKEEKKRYGDKHRNNHR